ncbi:MAG: hypothetical protein V4489_04835 [Chlamydiota bacterium]
MTSPIGKRTLFSLSQEYVDFNGSPWTSTSGSNKNSADNVKDVAFKGFCPIRSPLDSGQDTRPGTSFSLERGDSGINKTDSAVSWGRSLGASRNSEASLTSNFKSSGFCSSSMDFEEEEDPYAINAQMIRNSSCTFSSACKEGGVGASAFNEAVKEAARKMKENLPDEPDGKFYGIANAESRVCLIKHIRSEEGKIARGNFSEVFEPVKEQPQLHPNVLNDEIVIKILRQDRCVSGEKMIDMSLEQYDFLEERFNSLEEKNPPIVKIYNANEVITSRYMIAQKVVPFTKAPWDTKTVISELSPKHKKYYDTIVKLMEADKALERAGLSKMDLKWDNLGKDKTDNLMLIDYVNVRFTLDFRDSIAKRLAGNNRFIKAGLEEIEDRPVDLSLTFKSLKMTESLGKAKTLGADRLESCRSV